MATQRPQRPLHAVAGASPAPAVGRTVREPLLRDAVGELLRRERHRRGMSLRQLAAASRVSLAFLSEVERGRKEPSSEVLAAICRALGLPLVDLVGALHAELGGAEVALTSQAGPAASRGGDGPVLLAA